MWVLPEPSDDPYAQTAAGAGFEADRGWIWDFGGRLTLDKNRYINREIAIVFACLLFWAVWLRRPQRVEQSVLWMRKTAWSWPFVVYAAFALRGILFVPCTYVVRRAFESHPERTDNSTLWLWQVSGESIRYSLVAYEEIVLLICVLAFYGILYFSSSKARFAIRGLFPRI
jgi:hypothetical protein